MELVFIGERLQPRGFTHSEIAHAAIILDEHVIPTRDSVISSFQRLCRVIEKTPGMSNLRSGTGSEYVIRYAVIPCDLRVREVAQRVPRRAPPLDFQQ